MPSEKALRIALEHYLRMWLLANSLALPCTKTSHGGRHLSPECCEPAGPVRLLVARLRPPALRAAAEPPRDRAADDRPAVDPAKRTCAPTLHSSALTLLAWQGCLCGLTADVALDEAQSVTLQTAVASFHLHG